MRFRLFSNALMPLSLIAGIALSSSAWSAPQELDSGIASVQRDWAVIQYKTPKKEREARFHALADQAHALTQKYGNRAEPHIWEGIVLSSWAGAKGGLSALRIAKQARTEYETAIKIDANALNGSAFNGLGVLYYKVPGWPVGFGDNKKAEELLKQALSINPDGIDPNYFYADYLVYRSRKEEAIPYLEKALNAADRPGREVADQGRRDNVRKLFAKIRP